MSERIQKAFKDLVEAVVAEAKESVVPAVDTIRSEASGLFAGMMANMFSAAANQTKVKSPYPKDTSDRDQMIEVFLGKEKVAAIRSLKLAGKTDEQISEFLGIQLEHVRVVK